ncbi:MAG: sulfatase-like hydrolase/transferase [Bacteroidales bacterium]|nr:sulfatase-like hydrolase/transferase [Bacteroidales bacterium]
MKRIVNFLKGNIYLILTFRILLVFVLYSFCRLIFFWYNISFFPELRGKELVSVFTAGLLFDASAIVYTNFLFIVLFLLPFKFRHKRTFDNVLMVIFLITNGIAMISNLADVAYYEFVLQRTTMDVFDQFKHEENMGLLSVRFILDYWYISLFWVAAMTALFYFYRKFRISPPVIKSGLKYFFSGLVMFALGGVLLIGGARGGYKEFAQPINMNNAWAYVKQPGHAAVVLNTPFTLMHSLDKRSFDRVKYFDTEDDLSAIYSPVHDATGDSVKKENVVLIIVESLNREFVGALNPGLEGGSYEGFTPFLDSLVGVSRVFRHSYANGRKSIDFPPSVFCSIPRMGIPFVLRTPYYKNKLNSLPGLLKEMGYKSAFFHGAPEESFGFKAFTHIIGFDEYYGMTEYNNPENFDGSWGIWDEDFLQYFASTIDTFSTPFISAVFTLTSHHPFVIPDKYKTRFVKGDLPQERCIEYTDYAIRRFFEKASRMTWFNNTLFIITADHVSANQRDEFKNDVGYFAVPIIFYKPGGQLAGMDTVSNAQQIDIMPTVLNYLGYKGKYVAFGKDLFDPAQKNFAFTQLNETYRLFMDDKLLISDGKETTIFRQITSTYNVNDPGPGAYQTEIDSMELFLKAYIQQYINRMIDDRMADPK